MKFLYPKFDDNLSARAEELYELYEKPWANLDLYKDATRPDAEVLVIVGIGGSYLGLHAAVDFFSKENVIFLGNNLDPEYITSQLSKLRNKKVAVNVISKSGETFEPVVVLHLLMDFIKREKIDYEIFITTAEASSSLAESVLSYGGFIINMDKRLSGRYSTMFVGLPLFHFLGLDTEMMLEGAKEALNSLEPFRYASFRNYLYLNNFNIEVFQYYDYALSNFAEWWKQLFGESEGKNGKGIFPTSAFFTRDLHSLGQYLQEGKKQFFQTTLLFERGEDIGYLPGETSLRYMNKLIMESVFEAHSEGGSPNFGIIADKRDEYSFGFLTFFFQKAVLASALLLGVNPYDNNGVSSYKNKLKGKISK